MAKPGPKPKDKNDKVVGVTTYTKRSRILELGNNNYQTGLKRARALSLAAINNELCPLKQ